MIASLAFTGMILVTSAGLFGAYALGFYDGVKEGESVITGNLQKLGPGTAVQPKPAAGQSGS